MIFKAPQRWVTSPLGSNILLGLCGGTSPTVQKYVKIHRLLKCEQKIICKNVLYYAPCLKPKDIIKNPDINIAQTGKWDEYHQWICEHSNPPENINEGLNTKFILSNICIYKEYWNLSKGTVAPTMKIYNSFNYTQDIKYEARILELPIENTSFKLVIVVPNETDVLQNLIENLNTNGLSAAIDSIQPLFTVTSNLQTPCIDVNSKVKLHFENISDVVNNSTVQYGTAKIDNNGIRLQVITSIHSEPAKTTQIFDEPKVESPFYFALTYQDTPIFTGQYV